MEEFKRTSGLAWFKKLGRHNLCWPVSSDAPLRLIYRIFTNLVTNLDPNKKTFSLCLFMAMQMKKHYVRWKT